MTRNEFRKLLQTKVMILDGATGTELAKRGLPQGVCPEQWVLENPQALIETQRAYCEAGSYLVYACTFGGNRLKLEEFGLGDRVEEMNRELAQLSRQAVGDRYVFGDIAPTGRFVEPFGDLPFEEAVGVFAEQARGLVAGGVDGFVIETMMDIQEARAALLGVREVCDLPVMVTLTFGTDGRTLTGVDPVAALLTLQALGADAVGCNCSTGPEDMQTVLMAMKRHATVPLVAKPNAGMPVLRDGKTVFDMAPEEFGQWVPSLIQAGANLIGGCCGTSPAYIRAAALGARGVCPEPPVRSSVSGVSSARKAVFLGGGRPAAVIGERINPTGKKALQAELREGTLTGVRRLALEQIRAGADVLDVNVGLSGVDEPALMRKAIALLAQVSDAPLAIDTSDPAAMENALRLYPGRALVNSVSGEAAKLEKILPLAAKYGAMIVLLPLTDDGIPPEWKDRADVVMRVLDRAKPLGMTVDDIVVDGLVMTASADPDAPRRTMRLVEWCTDQLGANTVVGLSNVSFGLPQREHVNATFLAMCIERGLTATIANPCNELLMTIKRAADGLSGRDARLRHYAEIYGGIKTTSGAKKRDGRSPAEVLHDLVVEGEEESVAEAVEEALAAGTPAGELVDQHLIPAIRRVGEMFDRKEYFLPQLIMSADTMKAAFDRLEPHLQGGQAGSVGRNRPVVLATVKGDIHDIGKNLVGLMLQNYGYRVIDLGKDVGADAILDAAERENARVVGLSALMTTTMTQMEVVLERARQRRLDLQFLVGGAVVDQAYADRIGAAGYAPDAVSAVRVVQETFAKIERA